MSERTGRCLCGAVEFSFQDAAATPPNACHCSQCQQWSGHYWASIDVPLRALSITKGEGRALKWYRASSWARRGFCAECGSSLFWHAENLESHKTHIAIALGAVDQPTGAKLNSHIFVGDKSDYYDIADGLPQKETF